MEAILKDRNSARIDHKATVIITTRDSGYPYYATMYNFSGDGMYCGSDCSLRRGTHISIKLDKQPFKSAPKTYFGEVRWCEELIGDDNSHIYGIGIKINNSADY